MRRNPIHQKETVRPALALAALFSAMPGMAETWVARCNGLQFHFNRESRTMTLFVVTTGGSFQVARGDLVFDNGVALRAPLDGNTPGFQGQPLTQIGINRSRGLVYALYQHPSTGEVKEGEFCQTKVEVQTP